MPHPGVSAALAAIRGYQRFISPHKGFSCAYRCHTGCASCSALGFRAIRRYGVWRGIGVLRRRFARCAFVHRRYSAPPMPASRLLQAGFCDLSCDGLDLDCCDFASCDLPRGCSDRRASQKRDKHAEYLHIPPAGSRRGAAKAS